MAETRIVWLTITHYATKYGVHRQTVRKWLREGYLVSYQAGRTLRVQDAPPTTSSHGRDRCDTVKIVRPNNHPS